MSDLDQAYLSVEEIERYCAKPYSIEREDIAETQANLKLIEQCVQVFKDNGVSAHDTRYGHAKTVLQICRIRAARHDFFKNKDQELLTETLANIINSFDDLSISAYSIIYDYLKLRAEIENEVLPECAYSIYLNYVSHKKGEALFFPPDRFYAIVKKIDVADPNIFGVLELKDIEEFSQQNTEIINAAKMVELSPKEIDQLKIIILQVNHLHNLLKQKQLFLPDNSPIFAHEDKGVFHIRDMWRHCPSPTNSAAIEPTPAEIEPAPRGDFQLAENHNPSSGTVTPHAYVSEYEGSVGSSSQESLLSSSKASSMRTRSRR